MITSEELRTKRIAESMNGYSKADVNTLLNEAADTVDAYSRQSDELYRKMEVLASKIEEYRQEEDLIKTAIIKAEKVAESIKAEATEKKNAIIEEANQKSAQLMEQAKSIKASAEAEQATAKEQADNLIAQAREYAKNLISEKNEEGNKIVEEAQKKANEAINSSKIVAQNILDQAKEISEDLLNKSKEEKEAYELLVQALKNDAKAFLEGVKKLYHEQLEVLDNAKLDHESEEKVDSVQNVNNLQEEVESLVSEMQEMENAIPKAITVDELAVEEKEPEVEEIPDDEIDEIDDFEEIEEIEEEPNNDEMIGDYATVINPTFDEEDDNSQVEFDLDEKEADEILPDEDEDLPDPMSAVEAFSKNSYEPVVSPEPSIPVINEEPEMQEEKSLFDDAELPFESYFNVKHNDVHGDKNQTISLIPPEDDEEDDEPKFKGFFKKKK